MSKNLDIVVRVDVNPKLQESLIVILDELIEIKSIVPEDEYFAFEYHFKRILNAMAGLLDVSTIKQYQDMIIRNN